jgi:DNA-directed RNA polymerase specialized sigma24 family protein
VFGIACKMLNDKDVANDIVQEVFIYYYERMQNGFQAQHLHSWLVRAAINKSIDNLEKRIRQSVAIGAV